MRRYPTGTKGPNFDDIQLLLPLPLPPRPGIRRSGCPKCGCVHTSRPEQMECLADHSQP